MVRKSMRALAKCAGSLSGRRRHIRKAALSKTGALLVSGLTLSRLGRRVKRGAARRLIRKFLAGLSSLLNPGTDTGMTPAPVPVRVRSRRY